MPELCKSDLPIYLSSVPDMVVMIALVVEVAMVVRVVIIVKTGMLVMVCFGLGHVSWSGSRWSYKSCKMLEMVCNYYHLHHFDDTT